jgi:glycogen debranching enzyme
MRNRLVDHVWLDDVVVTNHLHETSNLRVVLEIDSDFADLFEVKDGVVASRDVTYTHDETTLTLAYERDGFRRSVAIAASSPASVTRAGFEYNLQLAPGEQRSTNFTISPFAAESGIRLERRRSRGTLEALRTTKSAELETWLAGAPTLHADDPALMRTYRASLTDLGALRMHPDLAAGATLPAAGLPWFMALFGRDSLITSFQALPYLPGLAATTLRVLAARQAVSRFSRAGAGKDPPRAALRGTDRTRRTTPFAVLRKRRCHTSLPRVA